MKFPLNEGDKKKLYSCIVWLMYMHMKMIIRDIGEDLELIYLSDPV